MIKVLLVDDHALFREGMKSILQVHSDIEVIGDVASGEEALACTRKLPPDVVLMDINMPGIGGIEATRRLLRGCATVRVIALTALHDEPFPHQLLDAGAVGYLSKGCPAEEVILAIRKVMQGQQHISSDIAQRLSISALVNKGQSSPLGLLSPREMQVMLMITEGKNTQQISDTLFLSPKTISTYRSRMFEKLGVKNDVELTHFALRHGLIGNL